jgi:predicted polyphosphate/ATP-dependent NAD kinase
LLGIDIVYNQALVASDVDEQTILKTITDRPVKMVVTVIGGQGHVFGRGNQQLSADVIRHVGQENIIIVATNDKLRSLNKRPMISDTGDPDLDRQLAGLYPVVTGYQQQTLYRMK